MNEAGPSPVFRFASFEVDLEVGELRRNGYRIRLQEKPFQILVALLERPGGLITREELCQRLWRDNTFVDFDHNLNNAVNKLREALNDSPEKPRFIETIPRRGYRFICETEVVRVVTGDTALALSSHPNSFKAVHEAQSGTEMFNKLPATSDRTPQGKSFESARITSVIRNRSTNRYRLIACGLTAAAMLLLFLFFVYRNRGPVLSTADLVLITDSVNSTGDPVFDDTLKQAISVELTQSPYLNVLTEARGSALLELMMKPSTTKVTPELARDLCQRAGAKAYIYASIAKLGGQYVIGLNAVHCQTGIFLAREQVTAADKEHVLKMLGQTATNFRRKLGESLSSVQQFDSLLEQATTPSLEALKAYSLANSTRSDAEAIPLFKHALEIDPEFALAYDGLGIAYSNINEPGLAQENIAKAYELRGHTSEREKLRITADYFQVVTGELEKANETSELWAQVYPRDHYPHNLMGVNYEFLGKYEKAASETLDAVRLNPDSSFLYSNLMEDYTALGRIEEAKGAYSRALALKRDQVFLHMDRYGIAFLQGDATEMNRQVLWSVGRPGAEDWLLSTESDTSAYFGRLARAREFSQRAAQVAVHGDEKEAAAIWQMNSALREAEMGNLTRARREALAALDVASTRDTRLLGALTLSRAGENGAAEQLANAIAAQFPLNTVIQSYWLPTIRASLELNRGHGAKAIEYLEKSRDYEWGAPNPEIASGRFLYPIYLRGQAYLFLRNGAAASLEFKKMLDHPEMIQNCPLGALAQLGLARALAIKGDTATARDSYNNFLKLWQNADDNLLVLKKAKSEYAKLR